MPSTSRHSVTEPAIHAQQSGSRQLALAQPSGSRRDASVQRSGIRRWAILLLTGLFLVGASPAAADRYNPERSGHPLRIAAYIVYPVGVILDRLIVRPAHWLAHREALKGLFGHTD